MRPLPSLLAALLLTAGLRAASGPQAAFTENLSWGQVEIVLRAEPPQVAVDHDLVVTLTVTAPATMQVELPDLRGRFGGFAAAEGYAGEPETLADGRRRREHRWRLTPELARAYRLAPFAVQVTDQAVAPARVSSFATRPVLFPAAELGVAATGGVEVAPEPHWIPPTRRMMLGWSALVMLAAAALFGLVRLALMLRRRQRLRRLSPRERAFVELEQLLRRGLLEKGLYKDFYIELTQVVRRYIERSHGIRAPEQTTEEFLEAASSHPRFTPAVLARLRDFLQAADLVKFAGQESNPQVASAAVRTAREYVEQDAATPCPASPTQPPSSLNDRSPIADRR